MRIKQKQEQRHVVVGPRNAQFISIRKKPRVRRGTCEHAVQRPTRPRFYAAAAAAHAAVCRQVGYL